jgi:hypothetical protein
MSQDNERETESSGGFDPLAPIIGFAHQCIQDDEIWRRAWASAHEDDSERGDGEETRKLLHDAIHDAGLSVMLNGVLTGGAGAAIPGLGRVIAMPIPGNRPEVPPQETPEYPPPGGGGYL